MDGHRAPIHRVDGLLMGVHVPGGVHQVRFRYRPILAQAGVSVAICALILAWSFALVAGWRPAAPDEEDGARASDDRKSGRGMLRGWHAGRGVERASRRA
jgi:hypothetical protein